MLTRHTQVVLVRENVCVWPSRNVRIPGRLCLVSQHCVLFLSWCVLAGEPAALQFLSIESISQVVNCGPQFC